jgi:hypothetical protein
MQPSIVNGNPFLYPPSPHSNTTVSAEKKNIPDLHFPTLSSVLSPPRVRKTEENKFLKEEYKIAKNFQIRKSLTVSFIFIFLKAISVAYWPIFAQNLTFQIIRI